MEYIRPHNSLYDNFDNMSHYDEDKKILGNWQVWIYGRDNDCTLSPRCHLRLKDGSIDIEVSLLTWDIIANDTIQSWDNVVPSVKENFFKWLETYKYNRPLVKRLLYITWDIANAKNPIKKWISNINDIDIILLMYLNPEDAIDIIDLKNSIYECVSKIYQKDNERMMFLHQIAQNDIIRFTTLIKLPFNLTAKNTNNQMKKFILKHENRIYEWFVEMRRK